MPAKRPSRLLGVDILRAIAVLAVLFVHAAPPESTPATIKAALALLGGGGWIGVDLFFVLSGFLVSSLLFKEYSQYGALRPGHFLIRRALKIYPAFYAMLGLTLVYGALGWRSVSGRTFLAEGLFVQNYFPFIWGHTWTLAVEEHFYLVLTGGLFVLALRGKRNDLSGKAAFRPLVSAYLVIASVCLLARALVYWSAARNGTPAYLIATHLRVDELFFGVLLSYFWTFDGEELRNNVRRHRNLVALAVATLVPTFFVEWKTGVMGTIGFVILYLTSGALLLLVLLRQIPPSRATAVLGRIGVASYSIYLWHLPWRVAVQHITGWMHLPENAWAVPLLLYFVGSVAGGVAAAAFIELPVLRIRDRLLPSRSSGAAPFFGTAALISNETDADACVSRFPDVNAGAG